MFSKIIATLSSLAILLLIPNLNTFAQCTDDTHSTNPSDMWISCQTSMSPNTAGGVGHWIMYDLGHLYNLGPTTFWNYNLAGQTGFGFKDIVVDYSIDGTNWTEAGTFQLDQADGDSNYEGVEGIDLTGVEARYILITGLSTWNDSTCGGLSEIQFDIEASNSCGDFIVNGNQINNPIVSGIYYSNEAFSSNGQIINNIDVTFKSDTLINLEAGFEVQIGSEFLGIIDECQPSGSSNNNSRN